EGGMMGWGGTSGPQMVRALYNSNYQIVQTRDTIMILVEMVHDVRRIRMNAEHLPRAVLQFMGDSVGHWEGDTLVVDTTNFRPENAFRGATENLHVVERFQRVDQNTILYRAIIEDPATSRGRSRWNIRSERARIRSTNTRVTRATTP